MYRKKRIVSKLRELWSPAPPLVGLRSAIASGAVLDDFAVWLTRRAVEGLSTVQFLTYTTIQCPTGKLVPCILFHGLSTPSILELAITCRKLRLSRKRPRLVSRGSAINFETCGLLFICSLRTEEINVRCGLKMFPAVWLKNPNRARHLNHSFIES